MGAVVKVRRQYAVHQPLLGEIMQIVETDNAGADPITNRCIGTEMNPADIFTPGPAAEVSRRIDCYAAVIGIKLYPADVFTQA